jgi:ABC-2 type transport system permease protein
MNGLKTPAALRVAQKDIKILLKERGTLLYLFVIPLVFVLGFSATSVGGTEPKEEEITVPVVNLDAGSDASQALVDILNQGGGIECELYDEARAASLLDKGKINRVLTIPANYALDVEAGRHVTLQLVNGPDASATKSEAVHRVVAGVTSHLSLESQLITSFRQMADMQAASPGQAFPLELAVEQAQSQLVRSQTEPLLGIEESWPKHLLEEDEEDINSLNLTVPGFAVMFIFLTAQTTAQAIYEEKKIGSFRRLLAAPISKATILVGKMTPNFLVGLAQIVVIFGAGLSLLPLLGIDPMTLGNDPLALILLCLAVVLCSTSLGVLIAGIARTEGQISGLSQVLLWIFGFAGILLVGMPVGSTLETVSQLIPHYWANTAFMDLLVRGQGLADIMPSILVLLGFTAAFLAVGLWRFKFD